MMETVKMTTEPGMEIPRNSSEIQANDVCWFFFFFHAVYFHAAFLIRSLFSWMA
ncbi:unnamed protein product [Notodromas monacha]|uniref:Uncharacterized protein n=1 Tax=Notodromas monacha TaxID=399045 RepID=A0A7R9GIJ0_9CRUS|nr:unnamed protein product [Notodromas monacha]CAG0924011.1 unnamed protein product [Notodromas monacha]